MKLEGNNGMELFEEEVEIYNSKLRLMSWLYDELRLYPDKMKDKINDIGQKLPLNL
jgi:hypothetical protein